MKKIELTVNEIDILNELVGEGKNKEAVNIIRKIAGAGKAIAIEYQPAFAGKYAPKGYGQYGERVVLWANQEWNRDSLVFSYFLSNLEYANVYVW